MNDYEQFEKTIRNWFSRETGGTLMLPTGWFGRPFDNIHQLTSIAHTDNTLDLVLDGKYNLHFENLCSVQDAENELVFYGFKSFRFFREDHDDNTRTHERSFSDGTVKLIK